MGSLMAGWDTHPVDTQKALMRSKTSLTKEEIEAFWRSKQRAMEEHLREAAAQKVVGQADETGPRTELPTSPTEKAVQLLKEWKQPTASSRDWWTRSNSAFLNDPPETDWKNPSNSKYAPQFHVADQVPQSL